MDLTVAGSPRLGEPLSRGCGGLVSTGKACALDSTKTATRHVAAEPAVASPQSASKTHVPAPGAAVRVYLSPAELTHLARLAYLEGVTVDVLASEWVSRQLRWLMSIRRESLSGPASFA